MASLFQNKCIKLRADEGRHKIELVALLYGEDVVVVITGCEKPHVRSVAVSVTRPIIKIMQTSSTTSFSLWLSTRTTKLQNLSQKNRKGTYRVTGVLTGIYRASKSGRH